LQGFLKNNFAIQSIFNDLCSVGQRVGLKIMTHSYTRLLAVLLAVFLFDFLFWQEKLGLNALIFTAVWLGALLWAFPESRSGRRFQVTAGGMALSAVMVTWHNSGAAQLTWAVSAMCAAGFAQERQMRFVLYALMQYLQSFFFTLGSVFGALTSGGTEGQHKARRLRRNLGMGCLPLLVVAVFYGFYAVANPKFADLSERFWAEVWRFFSFDVSLAHLFFVGFGLFLCGGAIFHKMAEWNEPTSDVLLRVRRKFDRTYSTVFPVLALRREQQQSVLLLVMLNALLLLVNLTDVRYVWFGFGEEVLDDLKSYVHEGTYALVASILVAMGVLFHIFRKNLNFYPNNLLLKRLAAAWLIQNAVLSASVAVRNWRYVDFHGLAYKRIGVFLFLLLVAVGLLTLWLRIRDRRTTFWLWHWNGWALYALLLLNACVNWDVLITRYNLSGRPRSTVDVQHMIHGMSSKNLHILEENMEQLGRVEAYPNIGAEQIQTGLKHKREHFERGLEGLSWKSCNGADARNRR
jgi:hypothetical protein